MLMWRKESNYHLLMVEGKCARITLWKDRIYLLYCRSRNVFVSWSDLKTHYLVFWRGMDHLVLCREGSYLVFWRNEDFPVSWESVIT